MNFSFHACCVSFIPSSEYREREQAALFLKEGKKGLRLCQSCCLSQDSVFFSVNGALLLHAAVPCGTGVYNVKTTPKDFNEMISKIENSGS